MDMTLLQNVVVIVGLSILVTVICHRLKIPAIVGFFLTGILAGPHGLGWVNAAGHVETLAEVGVVLLLFSIGIEFSLKNLALIGRTSLLGGAIQVLLTFGVVFLLLRLTGMKLTEAIFIGFLIAGSSTAIMLKIFQERAEVDTPHCRIGLAISIFQDITIVALMLLTPLLAGATNPAAGSLWPLLLKITGIILLIVVCTRWVVPRVMFEIARTRDRELFLLSTVGLCMAIAWLTSWIGLSLSLGAFLAGLIISDSPYSHQALGSIQPLRDVFLSFFFVSLGMLLNLGVIMAHPLLIVLLTLGVLVLKSILAGVASLLLGYPLRTAILAGFALSSVGEFSFVLAKSGMAYRLLDSEVYQIFLAISVFTMGVTPFLIIHGPRLAAAIMRLPWPAWVIRGYHGEPAASRTPLNDHLVIIGYGVSGRHLAQAARRSEIAYVIVELNPETVREEQSRGESIIYGDASQDAVLQQADVPAARIIVVAIPDAVAARAVIGVARRLNPEAVIIARTRFLQESERLYDLGADEVIPEEFEASMEIFTSVLKQYLTPMREIEQFAAEVAATGHEKAHRSSPALSFSDLKTNLPDHEIWTLRVEDGSPLAGKTIEAAGLQRTFGLTVLAIQSDTALLANPAGETTLAARDVLVVFGATSQLRQMAECFCAPGPA